MLQCNPYPKETVPKTYARQRQRQKGSFLELDNLAGTWKRWTTAHVLYTRSATPRGNTLKGTRGNDDRMSVFRTGNKQKQDLPVCKPLWRCDPMISMPGRGVYHTYKCRPLFGRPEFDEGHASSAAAWYYSTEVPGSYFVFVAHPISRPLHQNFVQLPPFRYSDSPLGSHSRLSPPPLPTKVRALEGVFIARRVQNVLPSSTRVELRVHTLRVQALSASISPQERVPEGGGGGGSNWRNGCNNSNHEFKHSGRPSGTACGCCRRQLHCLYRCFSLQTYVTYTRYVSGGGRYDVIHMLLRPHRMVPASTAVVGSR